VNAERILLEVKGGVADIRLNRPEKRNALDIEMFEAIREVQQRLAQEPGVRVAVLSGEGLGFCSGIDLGLLGQLPAEGERLLARPAGEPANLAQSAAYGWRRLPIPVIAAVHGVCFGGGLQIALGADLRIAHPDAQLSVMEIRLGLLPDMAISTTLPRLMRADLGKELAWTGRIVAGSEAAELGLVTRVADAPLDAALQLGRDIAAMSPDAVRAVKRLFDQSWAGADPAATLELETELARGLLGSRNQLEAVRAALAKDEPSFTDPTLS
jgi:enoyl-CoA hydratase/carnithine racemase